MSRPAAILLLALLLPAPAATAGLRAGVLTIGPGDLAFERFGHNALVFYDDSAGRGISGVSYDWGRFDFEQPGFLARFVRGDMTYGTGRADAGAVIDFYLGLGRDLTLTELDLPPDRLAALLRECERAYRPENREYRYDYFTANCSTKVRDAIDAAVGGGLREALVGVPAGTTYRREGERCTSPDPVLWFGFHAGFGPWAERPVDAWEQSFLPAELRRWLAEETPYVRREIVLQRGPTIPEHAPSRWAWTGLIGLAAGGVMTLATATRGRRAGWLATTLAAAWFTAAGLAGALGLFLWAFTGHVSGHANQSILLLSPLGLLVAALLPVRRTRRAAAFVAAGHLGLCVAGAVLLLTPAGQHNAGVVTLALPLNLAAAWIVWSSLPTSRRNRLFRRGERDKVAGDGVPNPA